MKNQNFHSIIKTVLSNILIEDEGRFHVKGKPFLVSHRTPYQKWTGPMQNFGANPGDAAGKRNALVSELSGKIYSVFYTSGKPEGQWLPEHKEWPQEEKDAFMDQLSKANQTKDSWDYWWSVTHVDRRGTATVQKNNQFRTLVADQWQPAAPLHGPLTPGTMVHIRNTKENRSLQTVFYYVNSQELMPQGTSIGRFYFNLKPEGAAVLVGALTSRLNFYRVPFSFKCLNHANYYDRTDNAVLYIEKFRFAMVARILREIVKGQQIPLNETVPLFSNPIVPGLSFAEDPGNGNSFGMFWSDVVAETAVRAWERSIHDSKKVLNLVLELCEEKGIRPAEPWRRPNSFTPYNFQLIPA